MERPTRRTDPGIRYLPEMWKPLYAVQRWRLLFLLMRQRTNTEFALALTLRAQGASYAAIGRTLGRAGAVVRRWLVSDAYEATKAWKRLHPERVKIHNRLEKANRRVELR